MKSTNERKASQRQRDAEALDAFTKSIRDDWISGYGEEGKLIHVPYVANWREMMIWIRETFGKEGEK